MAKDLDKEVDAGIAVSRLLQPMLHGLEPGVQGVALADLVSLWVAGHHPAIRGKILDGLIDAIKQILPESIAEVRQRHGGFPPGWEKH